MNLTWGLKQNANYFYDYWDTKDTWGVRLLPAHAFFLHGCVWRTGWNTTSASFLVLAPSPYVVSSPYGKRRRYVTCERTCPSQSGQFTFGGARPILRALRSKGGVGRDVQFLGRKEGFMRSLHELNVFREQLIIIQLSPTFMEPQDSSPFP